MTKTKDEKHSSTEEIYGHPIEKLLKRYRGLKPKLFITPVKDIPSERQRAKMMRRLIEYNWPELESRFEREILRPMTRCFLIGTHEWIGCGKKDRHICRICRWETGIMNDPQYMGWPGLSWDKNN